MTVSDLNQVGLYEVLLESNDEIAKRARDDETSKSDHKNIKLWRQSDDETNMVCHGLARQSGYVQKNIREACIRDVQDILRIQSMCYAPSLLEDEAIFKKIIEQDMSYVVFDSLDNQSVVGYALVHRIPDKHAPPGLNTDILNAGDAWNARNAWNGHVFIHGLSVAPEWQGKGLASTMVDEIMDRASEAKSVSLFSVQDSQKFWEKHGFTEVEEESRTPWINSYGEDAVHMTFVNT